MIGLGVFRRENDRVSRQPVLRVVRPASKARLSTELERYLINLAPDVFAVNL
jgi:hypothetical protein